MPVVYIHALRAGDLHLLQPTSFTGYAFFWIDQVFQSTSYIYGTSKIQWNEKLGFRADESSVLFFQVRCKAKENDAAPVLSDEHHVALGSLKEDEEISFPLTRDGKPAGQIVLRIEWSKDTGFGPPEGGRVSPPCLSPLPRVVPELPANQRSFSQYYNATLLFPSPTEQSALCSNIALLTISAASLGQNIENKCGGPQIIAQLGLVYRTHFACVASQIRSCSATNCVTLKARLAQFMPTLPSWDAMKEWVFQVAACFCSKNPGSEPQQALGNIVSIVAEMIYRYEGIYPEGGALVQSELDAEIYVEGEYIEWAESVDVVDLLRLVAWLRAITTGVYTPVSQPNVNLQARHPLFLADTRMDNILNSRVHAVLARCKDLGLCPRRVWAITSCLPGREINLLALIPEEKDNFPIIKNPLHDFCTFDFCEEAAVDSTGIRSLHKCNGGCDPTGIFTFTALNEAAVRDRPTAWRLDGKSTLEPGQKFMAVSHVWSDGTGQSGREKLGHRVNQCLYTFFCDIAKGLGCEGIWWDAICIPDEKDARSKAIKEMHLNYENAEYTLVHDLYLCNMPWINAEVASFAIIMSSWFTRGWTALELARSKNVLVLFKSKEGRPVLKDLKDIFAKLGEPSTPVRQVSTTVIKAVQDNLYDLNGLLSSLGPRSTSWASDLVVIAQQLARAELPKSHGLSSHEQYIQVLSHLHQIYDAHIFHDAATIPGSWLPQTLLELPIAPMSAEPLHVQENGDVVGRWGLLEIGSESNLRDMRLLWNNKCPPMDLQVQRGLRSLKNHIFLVELNTKVHRRALLVKVMRLQEIQKSNTNEIPCQFVGPIYFRPANFYLDNHIVARIVNGGQGLKELELDDDDDAINYVWRKSPQSVTLATGSVGGPKTREFVFD